MKRILFFIIPLLVISCQTNPPTQPPVQEYGTIKILSNVIGAKIFLDGTDTGIQTPDSIVTVTVGTHIIEILKVGFYSFSDTIEVLKDLETQLNVQLMPILDYGIIKVTSNESGAAIYLDGVNTNKIVPDTIKTTIGTHVIELHKEGYDIKIDTIEVIKDTETEILISLIPARVVLIEDFANVSCSPCVTSNKILEQLTNQTFGRKKLVAVKYPTNFPSPVDLFYLANPADCNSRMNYYQIILAPTNIIDGKIRPIPSDSNDVKEKILSELAKIPQFVISVNHNISGSTYNISVSIDVKEINNIDFSKLVLHTVITETDIEFTTAPGSNGETKFYDVMRKMLPDNQGESLSAITQAGTYNFQRQITLNSSWNQNNINAVVFIQNKDTKEVYQAGSTF